MFLFGAEIDESWHGCDRERGRLVCRDNSFWLQEMLHGAFHIGLVAIALPPKLRASQTERLRFIAFYAPKSIMCQHGSSSLCDCDRTIVLLANLVEATYLHVLHPVLTFVRRRFGCVLDSGSDAPGVIEDILTSNMNEIFDA